MENRVVPSGIDTLAALVGIAVGAAGVVASEFYALNRTHLGLAICVGCLGYLVMRNLFAEGESATLTDGWRSSNPVFIVGAALFLLLVALSAVILQRALYQRPPVYFAFLLSAAALLVFEIALLDLTSPWKQHLLLAQILLLGVGMRAGAFYLYPSVSGNDPFSHQRWINELLAAGELPQNTSYSSIPLMHLLAGAIGLIFNGSARAGLFSISALHSIALLAVFPIGSKLFGARTGLSAAVLLNLSDYQIQWGVQIIPMSLGITWFVLILMALLQREDATLSSTRLSWTVVILLFLWAILFTHTLSSLILLMALLAIGTTIYFLKLSRLSLKSTVVSMTLAGLFGIAMLAFWMWSFPSPGEDFFSRLILSIKLALSTAQLGSTEMVTIAGSLDAWTVFVMEAGWTLLLAVAIMGLLFSFKPSLRRMEFLVWSLLMVVLLGIIYVGGVMGIQIILPARWMAFLYIPVCLLAGSFLSQLLGARSWQKLTSSFAVLLLGAITLLMLTSPTRSIPDSPLYTADLSTRPGLYESELAGLDYAHRVYRAPLAASAKSRRYLLEADLIDPRTPSSYEPASVIVVREPDINDGFWIPFPKQQLVEIVPPTQEFLRHLSGISRVRAYDNGTVQLFVSTDMPDTVEYRK